MITDEIVFHECTGPKVDEEITDDGKFYMALYQCKYCNKKWVGSVVNLESLDKLEINPGDGR